MRRVITALFLVISITTNAQKNSFVEFQVDLFTRHYWRGFVFGDMPAIEPQVTLHMNRFSFNIWAAQTLNDSYSEIDLIPSYRFGNLTLAFLDYYNPVQDKPDRYFDFSHASGRHSGEWMLSYNGEGKLPVRWRVASFVYGDRHPDKGHPVYSTYLEAGYPFDLGGAGAILSVGITPWESYYADRFAAVHAGLSLSRDIPAGEGTSVPLRLSFQANPYAGNAWVIFSIGLKNVRNQNKL